MLERRETRAKPDGEHRHRRYSGRVVGRVCYNYRPISILLQFCKWTPLLYKIRVSGSVRRSLACCCTLCQRVYSISKHAKSVRNSRGCSFEPTLIKRLVSSRWKVQRRPFALLVIYSLRSFLFFGLTVLFILKHGNRATASYIFPVLYYVVYKYFGKYYFVPFCF